MGIQYGYPVKFEDLTKFRAILLSEIEFAKKHFDFIEITLELDPSTLDLLLKYSPKNISDIKKVTRNFKVLGHFDWDINPFKHFKEICENIKILKKFSIQKITIHPYSKEQEITKIIQNNINFLSKINNFCKKNKIQLCLENNSLGIFNKMSNFIKLTNNIPDVGVTLDIGHANKASRFELNLFLKKLGPRIKHIHLHENINNFDHLIFKNTNKLKGILSKISSIDYNGTITLETFFVLKNKRYIYLRACDNILKRREVFIKQLEIIKRKFDEVFIEKIRNKIRIC